MATVTNGPPSSQQREHNYHTANVTDELEEDEGEDAGHEAHERDPHDDLEDVALVEGPVLRDLDLLVEQEGAAEGVHHDHGLGETGAGRSGAGSEGTRQQSRRRRLTWMTPMTITHPQKSKIPSTFSGKVAIRENCRVEGLKVREGQRAFLNLRLTVYGRKVISIMQA